MTPDLDDLNRIAVEIVLILLPPYSAEIFRQELSPEIRAARARIAARYCNLKRYNPFTESERQAKAEAVADWLKMRIHYERGGSTDARRTE